MPEHFNIMPDGRLTTDAPGSGQPTETLWDKVAIAALQGLLAHDASGFARGKSNLVLCAMCIADDYMTARANPDAREQQK